MFSCNEPKDVGTIVPYLSANLLESILHFFHWRREKKHGGKKIAEYLEQCNIVLNKNLLPWDDNKRSQDPSGIRIGTQEITRIGFRESDSKELASILAWAIKEMPDPANVKEKVRNLKSSFSKVQYCFGDLEAYKYLELYR